MLSMAWRYWHMQLGLLLPRKLTGERLETPYSALQKIPWWLSDRLLLDLNCKMWAYTIYTKATILSESADDIGRYNNPRSRDRGSWLLRDKLKLRLALSIVYVSASKKRKEVKRIQERQFNTIRCSNHNVTSPLSIWVNIFSFSFSFSFYVIFLSCEWGS